MNSLNRQLGISLVEILVALVISLFLLGGIVQVYTANKSSYAFTDAVGRIQENARFAMDTVTQDLRMAGFFGCTPYDPDNTDNITNNLNPAGANYDPNLHDFAGQGVLDGTEGDGLNGSDSITIRGAKSEQFNVVLPFNNPTSLPIQVRATEAVGNEKLEPGDVVMISNCSGADMFQVSGYVLDGAGEATVSHALAGAPGNVNSDPGCASVTDVCLSQTYGNDSSLFSVQAVTYAIQADANGEPVLTRTEFTNAPEELVEGVEQMQILYGIDTTNDGFPNQYVNFDNVADVNAVIAVRVQLLVRSDTGAGVEGAQTINFDGGVLNFNDNRLRQVFTTTVALRNRIGNTP